MITGTTKTKIDSIWDTIWTGGITTPSTVVEQITYLLFMKMLDDNQLTAEANAAAFHVELKEKIFKDGICKISENPKIEAPYKDLRWSNFHNYEPEKMFADVRDYVFPFIKTLGGNEKTAFSRYMKDAVFLIPTAKVLVKVVDGIDSLNIENTDIMGDAYEYLLGKMSAAGDNGQFRTPRHIIKMMVELMKPSLKDKILDPAMGSAGFLLGCADYIKENYSKDLMKTDNLHYFKNDFLSGFDTDQTMLRIGAMNLLLHGINNPNVKYQDSLSLDNKERNKYSLIMANPPFTGSVFQEDISKDLLAITNTKSTELLFVALFIKMLEVGGRCASIVPDGVLFRKAKAYKSLRKELVEHQKLEAVISMPSGIFKPYAGVSTGIIIFTKTDAGGTDNVWFYDMQADGYSLDDKRTPIEQNDIPDIIARFNDPEGEKKRSRTDKSFFVSKKELKDNDYILAFNTYKKVVYKPIQYESSSKILDNIDSIESSIQQDLAQLRVLLKKDLNEKQ